MKERIIIILAALSLTAVIHAQKDFPVTWSYEGESFSRFVEEAESRLGVRFFYIDEWVEDLSPGDFPGMTTLSSLLSEMFRGSFLYYYFDEKGNIIITKNLEIAPSAGIKEEKFFKLEEYSYEEEKENTTESSYIEIGNPAERNLPGNVNISGYITDSGNGESVSGASVYVQGTGTGTITNQQGFFNLSLPRGAHLIQFTFIGMKEKRVYANIYGPGEMNLEMTATVIPLRETFVYAQRNAILQRYESGVVKVDVESMKYLPTPMGDPDLTKSMLLVPGILSVGEGAIGFNVRGGSADQNLMLLYGAPVYYPSHFFGFFTSVNADILRDFTIYKGGIPARYGGRISSVVDLTTKDGNRKEIKGNAGISPVTAHLFVEGPIKKDTASFVLASRSTYSNWVLKLIDNPVLTNSRASFYDVNASVSWDINPKNRIDISTYVSHDEFKLNSDTIYKYDNSIVSARWRHSFTSRHYATFSLNNSNFHYNMSASKPVEQSFSMSHRINSSELKADFSYFGGRHEFRYGSDLIFYSVLPGSYLPAGDSSLVTPFRIPVERALEGSLYADERFTLTDNISINAGLRFSTYRSFGPGSVINYLPGQSKNSTTVTDTTTYGKGESIASYSGPEIRLSVNIRTSENSSLKLNYNHMRQYLHLLSNTISVSPTDTWKLSDLYLKPQAGDQVAAGFYRLFAGGKFETSAEVYYKWIKNMSDFKGLSNLLMNDHLEQDLAPVRGRAYGLELSIRKSTGRARWDAGYTWSRILLRSTGKNWDELINRGEWFPANYDKPHNLSFAYTYHYSRRVVFSTDITWSTGRPVTYPITSYYIRDKLVVHYSDRNKYRIPNYARVDVSLTLNGNLRSRKIANPHLVLSVYNLLGRENPYSVYFREKDSFLYGYKLSVFGRAIPSVSYKFDF